jgi:hypothetical protein
MSTEAADSLREQVRQLYAEAARARSTTCKSIQKEKPRVRAWGVQIRSRCKMGDSSGRPSLCIVRDEIRRDLLGGLIHEYQLAA